LRLLRLPLRLTIEPPPDSAVRVGDRDPGVRPVGLSDAEVGKVRSF